MGKQQTTQFLQQIKCNKKEAGRYLLRDLKDKSTIAMYGS